MLNTISMFPARMTRNYAPNNSVSFSAKKSTKVAAAGALVAALGAGAYGCHQNELGDVQFNKLMATPPHCLSDGFKGDIQRNYEEGRTTHRTHITDPSQFSVTVTDENGNPKVYRVNTGNGTYKEVGKNGKENAIYKGGQMCGLN